MSKQIILGASGFVGQALVRALDEQKADYVPHSSKTLDLTAKDAPRQVAANIEAGDTIVLLSAYTPEKGDAAGLTVKNVQMVQHILDGIRGVDIGQFIYISSDAVYPLANDMVDEYTSTISDRLYGFAHILREQMLREVIDQDKLTILRPCAIYGDGDTHNAYGIMRFIRSAIAQQEITLFGQGEEYRDHLHVDDLANIIAIAAKQHISGVYNVASGKSWRFTNIASYIADCLDKPTEIIYKPRAIPIQHRHMHMCKLWQAFPNAIPRSIDTGIKQVIEQLA